MAVWNSLWSFVLFFPIWNVWNKKNLATLIKTRAGRCCPVVERSLAFYIAVVR
jgi:hypothetical protein